MKTLRELLALLTLVVSIISALGCPEIVLPGDEDCRSAVQTDLGENERVLLDTWSQQTLAWDSTFGPVGGTISNCKHSIFACVGSVTIFSPPIDVKGLVELSANVDMSSFYVEREIDVCIEGASDCTTLTAGTPEVIPIPSGKENIKLEFKSPASSFFFCTSIERITVKYDVCPCEEKNLVLYPEVPRRKPGTVTATCVENASPNGSLEFSATTCTKDAQCICDPGYEERMGSCQSCPNDTYSPNNGATCSPCPDNSEAPTGSSSCTCKTGYFRTTTQTAADPCAKPPSAVSGAVLNSLASTSLSLQWQCPAQSERSSNIYYRVCHRPLGGQNNDTCKDIRPNAGAACLTSHEITGLKPHTRYSVCITSLNTVTHLQPESEKHRTVCHSNITQEDVPSLPILKRLCTVVIWKPPAEPNGYITMYELKFVDASGQVESFVYNKTENFHLTTTIQREQNVGVQIRVKNGRYYSEWVPSSPQPIDCSVEATCAPDTCDCESTTIDEAETTTVAPTTTEEPETTTDEPISTTEEPITTTEEPVTTTEEPVTTTEEPVSTTEKTVSTTAEQPAVVSTSDPGPCPGYTPCGSNVYFEHSGQTVTSIGLDDIGSGGNALLCKTDHPFCCKEQQKGEFLYPNGDVVGKKKDGEAFFRNRGQSLIRLNAQSSSNPAPRGTYCCLLPDIDLQQKASSNPECYAAIDIV